MDDPLPSPNVVFQDLTPLWGAEEGLRGAGDGGGVNAVVGVEIAAATGLAEVVHAEGQLGHTQGRAEEGEAV